MTSSKYVLSWAVVIGLGACESPEDLSANDLHLNPALSWYGDNRARLDGLIAELGRGSASYHAETPPVAVFDWDNTVIKNDLGDATVYYLLRHGAVRQPPQRNWRLSNPFLTSEAVQALSAACDSLATPGEPLPTDKIEGAACATEIVTIYSSAQTTGKKAAFAGWNYRRMEPAYAWAAQLLAGYSPDEARVWGEQALQAGLAAQLDSTQTIGAVTGLAAWLRFYPQQENLIGVLKQAGFDVWIVSASPQQVIEAGAARVGIARDHVIGIRLLESGGRLTANLSGCGAIPDGTNDGQSNVSGNSIIPYIEGKRCFINKVIFGDLSAAALMKQSDPARRQVFAAGDSDTDISFVQDATRLKLVLNRNKKELMCNAYANAHGRWLINPMFIEPLPQRASGYTCATDACKNETGQGVPCRDEDGNVIPDQHDAVFAP